MEGRKRTPRAGVPCHNCRDRHPEGERPVVVGTILAWVHDPTLDPKDGMRVMGHLVSSQPCTGHGNPRLEF